MTIENWDPQKYSPYILCKSKGENIYVPNAFTPDDDNVNDFFTVYANQQISSIKNMKIFDRWGNLIFAAENLTPNSDVGFWDGTFKGKKVNPGVFVYSFTALMLNGSEKQYSGDVTIIKSEM